MAISGPGKMNAPFTFYSHVGSLGEQVRFEIDHASGVIDINIRRAADSSRIVKLSGPQATSFAHLTLHRHDLATAKRYLDVLDTLDSSDDESHATACEALWIAAVVTTIKCFDASSAARDALRPDTVLGTNTPVRADFNHIKFLRNKHISHDESNWLQSIPTAIIDEINGQQSFGGVHGMVIRGESANADNLGKLRRVIDTASAWVHTEWDQLAETLTNDLRSRSKAELAALPDVSGDMPHEGSVGVNRGRSV